MIDLALTLKNPDRVELPLNKETKPKPKQKKKHFINTKFHGKREYQYPIQTSFNF